ncbi:MAG: hydrolase [Bacteroidetes bacterium]|nr:MAG: hydrolase [Bacteroidota bacterium]
MRKFLPLALFCISINASGQLIYFPSKYTTDSVTFSKNAPALARQIIFVYQDKDKVEYYDNLFRLNMVAEDYQDALTHLDSFRRILAGSDTLTVKGVGFHYEVYIITQISQPQIKVPFNEAYQTFFPRLLNALPLSASAYASNLFEPDMKVLHDGFYKLLNNRKSGDSISLDDAKMLCRAYNTYRVYSQTLSLVKPMLAEFNNKTFISDDSVLVRSRDGATLSLREVRKTNAPKKLPAILLFNIYSGPLERTYAKDAAIHGYVGVVANVRGKRLSPQEIEPFEHDANDAYDVIDWISKQPWCDGRVGMLGGSYLGFTQWAAAKKLHPALKTIIPQVAVGIGVDYPMQNNIFMSYMLRWIHYVTNSKEVDQDDFNNDRHWDSAFTRWYVSGKSFRSLDTIEGRPNKIFQRWLLHPSQDTFWQNMVAYQSDFSQINIPILTTTGYYDDDQLGAMYYFNQHHMYNRQARHYLVIGPYDHFGAQALPRSEINGYKIDSVANININDLAYKWFDFILKDSARPALLQDNINYEVMGENIWKHVASLTNMNNDTIAFYLTNVRAAQHYKMDEQLPLTSEFIRQEIVFKDRSDTVQNKFENIVDSVFDSSNGLTFISKPFEKGFEFNGSFLGELKLSINKRDVDISVSVYEQMPTQKYFKLGSYITRASYAKDRQTRQLLQPDKIETVPINNSFFISRKIKAGSRLLLVLSVLKNPQWQINYGSGKDVSDETIADAKEPLEIKWYNSSVIKVPVWK